MLNIHVKKVTVTCDNCDHERMLSSEEIRDIYISECCMEVCYQFYYKESICPKCKYKEQNASTTIIVNGKPRY